jgi:hypothetical protein
MSGDISLRLKKDYEKPFLVGREAELNDLESFLQNSNGGTVLLGGLRGSGKTKLLDELQKKLKEDKEYRFLFIDVVLHDDIKTEELRTVLLKSITYSLFELEHTLPWWKANGISLFGRYLMPWLRRDFLRRPKIGRRRFYRRLIKIADYTTVSEIISREASLQAKRGSLEVGAKHGSSLNGEIDLSSARLEQMLRNYFEAVCRLGVKVVFVFDELDKLHDRAKDAIDAQTIASKFKNLLTRNGTYAIFVTSESELRRLKANIDNKPYQIAHTLFSKTLLLNQMNPDEFQDVITRFFTPAALQHEQFDMVCDYLMWESGLHLFSLGQVIDRHKVITDKGVHRLALDGLAINYDASYQYFLNLVYGAHKSQRSDFYNRVLYLSLRMVLQRLSTGKQLYFDNNNFLTLLANSTDFEREADPNGNASFKIFLGVTSHPQSFAGLFSGDDDWRQELALLKSGELAALNNALRDLVWQLDRAGLVLANQGPNLSSAASEMQKQTLDFLGDGLGYENCKRLESASKQTPLERELRLKAVRVRHLTERLGVSPDEYDAALAQYGVSSVTLEASNPKSHYYRPFSWEIQAAQQALERIEQDLPGQLFERFTNAVISKLGGDQTDNRSLPIAQTIRTQGLPRKMLNISTENGGFFIHFVAGATPEQQTRIIGFLQHPHVVVNLLHGLSGDQHQKHDNWRNVTVRLDYANFKQAVSGIVRRLKSL